MGEAKRKITGQNQGMMTSDDLTVGFLWGPTLPEPQSWKEGVPQAGGAVGSPGTVMTSLLIGVSPVAMQKPPPSSLENAMSLGNDDDICLGDAHVLGDAERTTVIGAHGL